MQGAQYKDRRWKRNCGPPLDVLMPPASAAEAATGLVLPSVARVTSTPELSTNVGEVVEPQTRCD
jgi:hypothetical protein